MENYTSKAKTTLIRATSRQSVKIHDQFYTIEFCEERTIPDMDDVNLVKERQLLWDDVNSECDNQITEIDDMWRAHEEEIKKKISHK